MIRGLRTGDNGGLFDNDGTPTSLFNPIFDASTSEWGEGNIILGGSGSDLIEGRGGDDIIDGDLKLDVRILITDGGGTPIALPTRCKARCTRSTPTAIPCWSPESGSDSDRWT